MAVAVSGTANEIVLDFVFTDTRGQTAKPRLAIDPATTDTEIATFLTAVDAASNALISVEVTTKRPVTGLKTVAGTGFERNISEVMEVILDAINPVSPTARHISSKLSIYMMNAAIENFPDGSLDATDTNIVAIITFLNAHSLWVAQDGTNHVGLLQVDTAASHHVTVEDIVDTV